MLNVLQYGNPILESKSEKVKDVKDPKIQKLFDDMLLILKNHGDGGAGLSAPQVGVLKRVIICRRLDLENARAQKLKAESPAEENKVEQTFDPIWEFMVNPEVIEESEKQTVYWEGCLSVSEGDLFGEVTRPAKVTVKFLNREGHEKTLTAKGYFSHVVQHEIDHLNGIIFLKYVPSPDDLYTSAELDEKRN